MPFCRSGGIDLYYETHGDGPALVFAHGRGGNHMSWWQQIPSFSERYRCIAFDHRSFGRSKDLPGGPGQDAFVNDLEALLDHLHVERAHLVAQSMGGRTCLGFALRRPERTRSLTLADTTAAVTEPSLLHAIETHGPPPVDLLLRVLGPTFRREQPTLSFLYAQIEALNRIQNTSTTLAVRGPKAADLATLRAPTLLLVGTEDSIAPPHIVELLAGMIPDARVAVVDRAGHSVYFERPDEFNRILAGFLAEAESLEKGPADKQAPARSAGMLNRG